MVDVENAATFEIEVDALALSDVVTTVATRKRCARLSVHEYASGRSGAGAASMPCNTTSH
jgi:hypothetical protein